VMLAILVYVLMYCWHRGTAAVDGPPAGQPDPIDSFMAKLNRIEVARVPAPPCS